jgi:hypothetical protein
LVNARLKRAIGGWFHCETVLPSTPGASVNFILPIRLAVNDRDRVRRVGTIGHAEASAYCRNRKKRMI